MANKTKQDYRLDTLTFPGDSYVRTRISDGYVFIDGSPYGTAKNNSAFYVRGGVDRYIEWGSGPKTAILNIRGVNVKVPVFKYCDHRDVKRTYTPGAAFSIESSDATYRYKVTAPATPPWAANWFDVDQLIFNNKLLPSFSTVLSAYAGSYNIFSRIANDGSLLGFPSAFNALQFIAELKDLKRLPEIISKWTKTSHDVSDKYLNYSFGWSPLFSDVIHIFDRLANSGKAIDTWNDQAKQGKILNGHTFLQLPDALSAYGSYKGVDPKTKEHIFVLDEVSVYNGSAFYGGVDIAPRAYASGELRIKAVASVYYVPQAIPPDLIDNLKRELWGINKPLSAAWELLPWSFVVDWFVNIGELINKFESQKPLLKIHVLNGGYSIKASYDLRIRVARGGADSGSFVYKGKFYRRTPVSPSSIYADMYKPYGSLQFTSVGGDKLLLGSALLHQLLR